MTTQITPLNTTSDSRWVMVVLVAAWLDWALGTASTLMTTTKPEMLGMGFPTMATQCLLVIGMSLGSSVARSSYIVWTGFVSILTLAGGDVGVADGAWATASSYLGYGLLAIVLPGLLAPPASRWFVAGRTARKQATRVEKRRRAQRNLKIACAWALVLPVAWLASRPLGTPALAVAISSLCACVVAAFQLTRQLWTLHKLQR